MLRIIIASLFLSLISTFSSAETVTLKCENTVIKYIDNWVTKDEVVVRKNADWQPYCNGNYKLTDGGVSCEIHYETYSHKYRKLNFSEKQEIETRFEECKKILDSLDTEANIGLEMGSCDLYLGVNNIFDGSLDWRTTSYGYSGDQKSTVNDLYLQNTFPTRRVIIDGQSTKIKNR